MGRPADGEVQLPIGSKPGELDAESMLKQMNLIVTSMHAYSLETHNCSTTTLAILNAGKSRQTAAVRPALIISTDSPQKVFNEAVELRTKCCKKISQSVNDLNEFFKNSESKYGKVVPQELYMTDMDEVIKTFAISYIFPMQYDIDDNLFYTLTENHITLLMKHEKEYVSTELLRDLWDIIPQRSLPLTADGSFTAVIDKNLTIGNLIQGLTVLASMKAEQRLIKYSEAEAKMLVEQRLMQNSEALSTATINDATGETENVDLSHLSHKFQAYKKEATKHKLQEEPQGASQTHKGR